MKHRSTARNVAIAAFVLLAAACSDDSAGNGDPNITAPNATNGDAAQVDAGSDGGADGSNTDSGDSDSDAAAQELAAIVPGPIYARVGQEVVLDGSASTGAVEFEWSFGDGADSGALTDPVATHSYDAVGRYQAVLTAWSAEGQRRTAALLVTVTPEPIHRPMASSTVHVVPGYQRVAVVSPDSNEVMVARYRDENFEVVRRLPTDSTPRTVTSFGDWLVVACEDAGVVLFERHDSSGEIRRVFLPRSSRPFGVIANDEAVFATLSGTGELVRIELINGVPQVVEKTFVVDDARHLSLLPDGRIAVSAWRSEDSGATIAVVSPDLQSVDEWTFEVDPSPASDTVMGGVPNYLGPLAVSPDGQASVLPFLQANFEQGLATVSNGEPLDQDKAVRAVLGFVDPTTGAESWRERKHYDDRGHAAFAVHSRYGDYAWVSMPSNRLVERYDLYGEIEAGTIIDIGYSPQGIALSPGDQFLFVDAYLSRELLVFDVSEQANGLVEPVARLPIPTVEPLSPEVLRGKQLFNDAQDQRITAAGYLACSNCHMEGLDDRRTWDFTERGEGLRNTTALVGRAGTGDGPIHWSGNFDEIQDFENDIRQHFGGTGLLDDADWNAGSVADPLGDPKAGLSAELDALAVYLTSLNEHPESPWRSAGELTPEAEAGKLIFESAETGCTACHTGPNFTDSRFENGEPVLHDVGTLTAASGSRLGGPLAGIDTPTLRGLWHSRPYLHDGSAATLRDVLTTKNPHDRHGQTSQLSTTELGQLEAYLLSL
jgi:hypothetical protein